MRSLLAEKRKNAEKRIRYERRLIKKIEYIEEMYQNIASHKEILIKQFPKTWILAQNSEKDEIMRAQMLELSKDQFVMSSLYSTYDVNRKEMLDLYITMEQSIMKEFGLTSKKRKPLDLQDCIYMVVKLQGALLQQEDVDALLSYAKKHELQYEAILYVHEIPLTSYMDESNYYAELYLPIVG